MAKQRCYRRRWASFVAFSDLYSALEQKIRYSSSCNIHSSIYDAANVGNIYVALSLPEYDTDDVIRRPKQLFARGSFFHRPDVSSLCYSHLGRIALRRVLSIFYGLADYKGHGNKTYYYSHYRLCFVLNIQRHRQRIVSYLQYLALCLHLLRIP